MYVRPILAGPESGPGRLLSSRPPRCMVLYTAFSPMIDGIRLGRCCRGIRCQPSDIDSIFNSTYHEADCTDIINLKYAEQTLIRCLVFILCALFEQDKVTILIDVCLSFGILSLVI